MNDDMKDEARGNQAGQALHDAIRYGDVMEVLRRLEEGVSYDWQDTEGCSLVFIAAYHRQWAVIDALRARGASVDLPDRRGWTPLFWAAFNGHADIVAALIERGADLDIHTSEGEWPLFWAVYKGHTAVVRRLLIGGAKRDFLDQDGHDVLWLARTLERKDLVAMLERRRDRRK